MVTLKAWNSSNVWEHPERTKILFKKKLRVDEVRDVLPSFGPKYFAFHFAIQKYKDQDV